MHKSATKCNETIGKWCKNKHGASKIIDTLETYQSPASQPPGPNSTYLFVVVYLETEVAWWSFSCRPIHHWSPNTLDGGRRLPDTYKKPRAALETLGPHSSPSSPSLISAGTTGTLVPLKFVAVDWSHPRVLGVTGEVCLVAYFISREGIEEG
jgi:hypothetical protein